MAFDILFTYHKIHPFKVYNSMVFSIFAVVQPSLQSFSEHLHHPKKKPQTH